MMHRSYRLGFDVWGLVLFLLVMLPNFIWFVFPAPNDVLRTESVTPVVDLIASICQVMTVACLCLVINTKRPGLRFSLLAATVVPCIVVYYLSWVLYYAGIAGPRIVLTLAIAPCVAFILFAIDRKNLPAVVFASAFTVCHIVFAVRNFL